MGRPPKPRERMKATQRNNETKANGDRLPAPYNGPIDRRVPDPPVALTGRGEVEWRNIWEAGFWLKRDQDYAWVEMVCQAYMDIEVFRATVRDQGLTVKGYAPGQVVAHPLIAEIRKCEQTIQKCLSTLGFSPTDRAKLNILDIKARSAFEEFMDRVSSREG